MAAIPLVTEQIDAGAKLVARLTAEGFPVTAASWVREDEDSHWHLYLVSPIVDRKGPREGYRRLLPFRQQLSLPGSDRLEVRLLGPTDMVAKAIIAIRDRTSSRGGIWHNGGNLGMQPIDLAYIYPAVNELRSSEVPDGVV